MEAPVVYNATNKVIQQIHDSWLQWMQHHHIPAMLATGCFYKASVFRLKNVDNAEGPTYVVQYFANSEVEYERYLSHFAATLRKESRDKWGDDLLTVHTMMELVN